ncbi:hypothetical protein TNCV_836751 [Trichonephila clavipes]|nr:hypothetical protein TNCV_836751 [Trichonephila clavipes]
MTESSRAEYLRPKVAHLFEWRRLSGNPTHHACTIGITSVSILLLSVWPWFIEENTKKSAMEQLDSASPYQRLRACCKFCCWEF